MERCDRRLIAAGLRPCGRRQRLENGQELLRQPPLTFGGRVEPVGLQERRVHPDLAHEAGHEGRVLFLRDTHVHFGKISAVVGTVVGRHVHAQQNNPGAGCLPAADDLAQVGLGVFEVLTAQGVVAAELDDQDVGGLLQHPVDAGEACPPRCRR